MNAMTHDIPQPLPHHRSFKLAGFLRWSGAILIVFSALGYMLQGYAQVDAGMRYWIGLLLTLALTAGGALCAFGLRENTGARIFFGLATAFVIVQSTQVSAMLYGWLHPAALPDRVFDWLLFSGTGKAALLADLIATTVVLWGVSYAGFRILARRHVSTLLTTYVAGNLCLLLPTRSPLLIPLMTAGLFAYLMKTERRLRQDGLMRTGEGRAARLLTFAPLATLTAREGLYAAHDLSLAVTLGCLAWLALVEWKRYTGRPWLIRCGDIAGVLLASAGWTVVYETCLGGRVLPSTAAAFIVSLSLLWMLLSLVSSQGSRLRNLAALATFSALSLDGTATWLLFAGMAFTAAAIHLKEKMTLLPGIACLVIGTGGYLRSLIGFYTQAPWISSAILGFTVILLASWLEKRDHSLLPKIARCYRQIRAW